MLIWGRAIDICIIAYKKSAIKKDHINLFRGKNSNPLYYINRSLKYIEFVEIYNFLLLYRLTAW